MADDELKDLPPEERIKKLKELEEKRKKEIAEAQKMLKDSEKELADRDEWERKVPIPEIAKEEVAGASEAEKEILKAHKGLEGKEDIVEEGIPEKKQPVQEEESLEETVGKEQLAVALEIRDSEYAIKLSQEPMGQIYQQMQDIYQAVGEKGYVSREEEKRIEYLSAATERKLEDIGAGRYSLTDELEQAALMTKNLGGSLIEAYQREKKGRGQGAYQS